MSGLVSIVVPTHNRASLIAETLETVLAQTHTDYEVIVVDDGSDDHTNKVIEDLRGRFRPGRLVYVEQVHSGLCAAMNRGTGLSRGDFIQYLDSDDILFPNKLAAQVEFLAKHPDVDAVYSYARGFRRNDRRRAVDRRLFDPRDKLDFTLRYQKLLGHTSAMLWRRKAVETVGPWDESLLVWMDWDFVVRYMARGGKLGCLRKLHVLFRVHGASVTYGPKDVRHAESIIRAVRKVRDLLEATGNRSYLGALSERACLASLEMAGQGHYAQAEELAHLLEDLGRSVRLPHLVRLFRRRRRDGTLARRLFRAKELLAEALSLF